MEKKKAKKVKKVEKKPEKFEPDFDHCPSCGSSDITKSGFELSGHTCSISLSDVTIRGIGEEATITSDDESPIYITEECRCQNGACGLGWTQLYISYLTIGKMEKYQNEFEEGC